METAANDSSNVPVPEPKKAEERDQNQTTDANHADTQKAGHITRDQQPEERVLEGGGDRNADDHDQNESQPDPDISLDQLLLDDIDRFVSVLRHPSEEDESPQPLEIPDFVERFLNKLESMIDDYDPGDSKFGQVPKDDALFIDAICRLSRLRDALGGFVSDSNAMLLLNSISSALHRAMLFTEGELRRCLLEHTKISAADPSSKGLIKAKRPSFKSDQETDRCILQPAAQSSEAIIEDEPFPFYEAEQISNMNSLARAMIVAGYDAECFDAFLIARRRAFAGQLKAEGYEKVSIEDVQRMQWETLEGEITPWIRILKCCSGNLFPGEKKFYLSVFPDHVSLPKSLLSEIGRYVFIRLLNFAEAVAMTKRSSEKLFKFLDMHEALRDVVPTMDDASSYTKEWTQELKSEMGSAGSRLAEAAVSTFCELETSIKSDNVKAPVPNGAVHPLTRYIMNYLEYACEYKGTLEQVFQQHQKAEEEEEQSQESSSEAETNRGKAKGSRSDVHKELETDHEKEFPFTAQLMTILDLLDKNLEAKSALYKDPSLKYIFLLNNGRYMLKKVRGSTEIHQVVGDPWCRKRSSDMRHYHKSYQRETWSKVLQCLSQEGLQVNGKVHKPVLKERFKSFNQLFDEIHKTQSSWVVSDDQLKSELRVSVSAVMIPAYRAFVARFGQYFTPGRQTEKYIKYQPEDIEGVIDEFFDGTTSSMARKRT